MILELRHLRLVHLVAKEGSLSEAARRLYISQPAASRQLSDLEDRLGVVLFHRKGRSLVPTRACAHLIDAAPEILESVDREESRLKALAAGEKGTVRLTTECYTCYHWLPSLLVGFRDAHPGFTVEIDTSATANPIDAVEDGLVDLAIASSDAKRRGLVSRRLFTDELVAIVHPGHPLASRKVLFARDFEQEHLIVYSEKGSDLIQEILEPAGVSPARISELQITDGIVELVKAGLGVSVAANWAVRREVDAGSLKSIKVTRRGMKRSWKAVVTETSWALPHIQTLVELIAASGLRPGPENPAQSAPFSDLPPSTPDEQKRK